MRIKEKFIKEILKYSYLFLSGKQNKKYIKSNYFEQEIKELFYLDLNDNVDAKYPRIFYNKFILNTRKSEANRPKTKILSYVLFNCLDYLNLDKNTKEMSYSYLISSNKYLPKQLIKKLWELKDKYKSIRNYYFVTQSNLPIEYLIELKDSQEIITNPNCPDSILLEKYDNINKFSKIYKAQLLLVLHKKGLLCLQPKSL